jgi:hypothetical protein
LFILFFFMYSLIYSFLLDKLADLLESMLSGFALDSQCMETVQLMGVVDI